MKYDEPTTFVADKDPKEAEKELVHSTIYGTLWWGVIIGFGTCLCLFGIGQQFLPMLDSNETIMQYVRIFWFDVQWWFWLVPLLLLVLLFWITRYKAVDLLWNKK